MRGHDDWIEVRADQELRNIPATLTSVSSPEGTYFEIDFKIKITTPDPEAFTGIRRKLIFRELQRSCIPKISSD